MFHEFFLLHHSFSVFCLQNFTFFHQIFFILLFAFSSLDFLYSMLCFIQGCDISSYHYFEFVFVDHVKFFDQNSRKNPIKYVFSNICYIRIFFQLFLTIKISPSDTTGIQGRFRTKFVFMSFFNVLFRHIIIMCHYVQQSPRNIV